MLSFDNYKKIKILCAEDSLVYRSLYTKTFSDIFNCFDIAKDGQEAWQKYQNKEYDLLLVDIIMPHFNGMELIQKIKEQNNNNITIILIMNSDDINCLLEVIRLDVDGFIFKPFEIEDLKEELEGDDPPVQSQIEFANADPSEPVVTEDEGNTSPE